MTLDLQRAVSQRMRRLIIALVALVLMLAGAVVALVIGQGGGSSPSAAPSASPSSNSDPSHVEPMPTETQDGSFVAPTNWVVLPAGAKQKDGLSVKFPHSAKGAAAAAAAAVRAGWTWNPDAAARAARVYSVPSEAATMEDAARDSTAASRTSVGLPGTGALPSGASMTATPIGVQWTDAQADHVTVSVLARVVYTTGAGAAQKTQVIASSSAVVWVDGDWHPKTGDAGSATAPEPFDLGTEGFNTAGWKAIQEGDTR